MALAANIIDALERTADVLQGRLSKEDLVERLLCFIIDSTHADWATFREYDSEDKCLKYRGFCGHPSPPAMVLQQRFAVTDPLASIGAFVFLHQEPHYCPDRRLSPKPGCPSFVECLFGSSSSDKVPFSLSSVNVPVTALTTRHGVISADSQKPDVFAPEEQEFITVTGKIMAVSLDLLEKEQKEIERMGLVAHQIIGPLSGLMGYCEALQKGVYRDPGKVSGVYDILVSQAERAIRATRNMLALSKLTASGETIVQGIPLDLKGLLIDVAEIYQGETRLRKMAISVQVDPNQGTWIRGDRDYLWQAVSNLVDNTVKYSDESTAILVTITTTSKWLRVTFQNTGMPLYGSDLERVFERGYRSEEAIQRVPGGTGIGLWYVERVMELHEGKAFAEPTNSKGQTFLHLCFPHSRIVPKRVKMS